jgi:hypothetical protein
MQTHRHHDQLGPRRPRRSAHAVIAGAFASALIFAPAHSAFASNTHETTCTGHVGAVTIHGNLKVPAGVDCILDFTTVTGSVHVKPGGALAALSVTIGGSIISHRARYVAIADCIEQHPSCHQASSIGASVTIAETNGKPPPQIGHSVICDGTTIGGDVALIHNQSRIALDRCTIKAGVDVAGSVNVNGNTGGVDLFYNKIDGSLNCRHNNPAPAAGDNSVEGRKTGQCADL